MVNKNIVSALIGIFVFLFVAGSLSFYFYLHYDSSADIEQETERISEQSDEAIQEEQKEQGKQEEKEEVKTSEEGVVFGDIRILPDPFPDIDAESGDFLSECDGFMWQPLCGVDRKTYPTPCIADYYGIDVRHKGICQSTIDFIKTLLKTPSSFAAWSSDIEHQRIEVKNPFIFHSLMGDMLVSPFHNQSIYTKLWLDKTTYLNAGYMLEDYEDMGRDNTLFFSKNELLIKPFGQTLKGLLIFYEFSDFGRIDYPEQAFSSWAERGIEEINKYLAFEQGREGLNPLQIDADIVYLEAGPETPYYEFREKLNLAGEQEEHPLIENVLSKAEKNIDNYDLLILAPIRINPSRLIPFEDGFSSSYARKPFEVVVFSPRQSFSSPDIGHRFYVAHNYFEGGFSTILHELLHTLGMSANHTELYQKTIRAYDKARYEAGGKQNISFSTEKDCEFLYNPPYNFALEPDENFIIRVGKEPKRENYLLEKTDSKTGPCLNVYAGMLGKDIDNDGVYELIPSLEVAGEVLAQALGWRDMDGDGLPPLIDPEPYGGIKIHQLTPEEVDALQSAKEIFQATVKEVISQKSISGCEFVKLTVESNDWTREVYVPTRCPILNSFVNDIYLNGPIYTFNIIDSPQFGEIALITRD